MGVNKSSTVVRSGETLTALSWMLVIPSYVVPDESELPVTARTFPKSSAASPYPDIQIELRKKFFGDVTCVSKILLPASGVRLPVCQPSSQPRERFPLKSQKLPNPAYTLP